MTINQNTTRRMGFPETGGFRGFCFVKEERPPNSSRPISKKQSLKERRIRKSNEIQYIFEKGERLRGRFFDIIFLKNNFSFGRFGIIVGKKCGGAVDRNYIKRIFREIVFNRNLDFNFPIDLLVVPKAESKKRLFSLLKDELFDSVQKKIGQHSFPKK
jgi:ribonuclease P protein component